MNLAVHGRADYLVGERRVSICAREMLWIPPRQNRLVIGATPDFLAWVLVVRPRLFRRVCTTKDSASLRAPDRNQGVLLRRLSEPEVRELAALYRGVPVGQGRDVFNAGLAYALARSWLAYRHATDAPAPAHLHPAVQRAAWLIKDSVEPLDNTTLAARAGLSPTRLSRLFKAEMGVPLAEFRNRQRLDHFLHLLGAEKDPNLLELSLEAGFGSYAQFHRVFRKRMGVSPAEYVRGQKRLDRVRTK